MLLVDAGVSQRGRISRDSTVPIVHFRLRACCDDQLIILSVNC